MDLYPLLENTAIGSLATERLLKIVIFGAGAVTKIFYLPALLRGLSGLALAGIVDRSSDTLHALGPLPLGAQVLAMDADTALADPAVVTNADIALIALPHTLHVRTVVAALQAGLHVFSEKPLGLTAVEVVTMIDAARKSSRLLGVCQPRRSFPVVGAIGELLSQGKLGAIKSVFWDEGQPYAWPAQTLAQVRKSEGGCELYDIGAHAFDLLCQWFGALTVTDYIDDSAGGTPAEFEVRLGNCDLGQVVVRLSRLTRLANRVVIEGERGTLTWHLDQTDTFSISHHTALGLPEILIKVPSAGRPASTYEAVQAQLVAFGQAVLAGDPPPVAGDSALAYTHIFDQCTARMVKPAQPGSTAPSGPEYLVIGAAGFIGCALVEELLRQEKRVVALVHQPASAVRLLRYDLPVHLCDVAEPDSYARYITPDAVIINCAVSQAGEHLERVIIDGALALLAAAEQHGARRVVLLSSMLAYGDPPPQGIVNENTAEAPSQVLYARAKAEMERRCLRWSRGSKVEVVVLQPSCVFGPFAKDFGSAPLGAMREGEFFLFDEGRAAANLVFVNNLVDAILLAVEKPGISGRRYIVNEDDSATSWAEFYGTLSLAAFGVPISRFPSLSRAELDTICARWRAQHGFPRVFREAVRASLAASDWLNDKAIFKAWKALRRPAHRVPEPGPSQEWLGATVDAPTTTAALEALKNRLLAQRRLFVSESTGRFYTTCACYSSAKIRDELGWRPRMDRANALRATAEWAEHAYANLPFKSS